jgi:protein arginine kinase activator
MQCQKCDSPATVHVTDLVKNEVTHLCADCAARHDAAPDDQTPLHGLLAGILQAATRAEETERDESPVCPYCSRTYQEFRQIGRFGCAEDYNAFGEYLGPLVERVQGATAHVGKRPRRWSESAELNELEHQLRVAVREEDYSNAADLRDRIREMRRK